jgi:DNA-binding ferritin-like protein
MSKYQYIRKHKLNGKKLDITNEVVGMMNINEYLLATVPKMTKLIDEIHDAVTDGSLTDQDRVYQLKRLFEMFEKQST